MFFSEEVKVDGEVKTVYAESEAALKQAVSDLKKVKKPVSPDINEPVEVGHDLTEVVDGGSVELVDGTNSEPEVVDKKSDK